MEIKVSLDNWPLRNEVEKLVMNDSKEYIKELFKDDTFFMKEISRNVASEIKYNFIDDINLRNLIISEFIKSMDDDAKKTLFLEALLKTRN